MRHVSAYQSHLQGVHTNLKTIYYILDYMNEFYNVQYILLLVLVSMWIKY